MKILIISDAWQPQINGVVRSLEATLHELRQLGHEVVVTGPEAGRRFNFRTPFYPEIRLEFFAGARLAQILENFVPDRIHIATEGPLGWAARNLCLRQSRAFTTSYHTRFPEYLAARLPRMLAAPVAAMAYAVLRRFHASAGAVMVATASIEQELRARGFHRLVRWSRGVDTNLFRPYDKNLAAYENLPRPILLYVGRIAIEKNLRAFLELQTPGTLIVIGDGPDLARLRARYPRAQFLGPMRGEELARHYAAADLFVFPSATDTFGLVLLEACAAGLRVAASPAPGPRDIFGGEDSRAFAVLDADLQAAVNRALMLPDRPETLRAFAARFSWQACTRQFLGHLQAPSPEAARRLARWRRKIS